MTAQHRRADRPLTDDGNAVDGHGGPNEGFESGDLEKNRAGKVPGPVNTPITRTKGGELVEIYILEVEVLEAKLAPIGGSSGGN